MRRRVEPPIRSEAMVAKFLSRVCIDPQTNCHVWQQPAKEGYGTFWDGRRSWPAHRYAYEVFVGCVAPSFDIDHLCGNKACVNPDHLEPVTQKVNIQRRFARSMPDWKPVAEGSENIPQLDLLTKYCPNGHVQDNSRAICRLCTRVKEAALRRKATKARDLRRTSPEVAKAKELLRRHSEEKFKRKIRDD